MVIRRCGSKDIVRIDNSPYAVYRKCYYEVKKILRQCLRKNFLWKSLMIQRQLYMLAKSM